MSFGPGLWPTFLYYFVSATLIAFLAIAQSLDSQSATGLPTNPYVGAILFGLLSGAIGTYFNRNVTLSLPVTNQKVFRQRLTEVLTNSGFQVTGDFQGFTIYQRPKLSAIFSGKLFVQVGKDSATIAGRASKVKALQKLLSAAG